jgi:hypothetical protein
MLAAAPHHVQYDISYVPAKPLWLRAGTYRVVNNQVMCSTLPLNTVLLMIALRCVSALPAGLYHGGCEAAVDVVV